MLGIIEQNSGRQHKGIKGNETADRLAKLAIKQNPTGLEPDSHGLLLHRLNRDSDKKRNPGPCPLALTVGSRMRF